MAGLLNWEDLSAPQFRTLEGPVVAVLPLGATEQHGPHLPVSVDSDLIEAVLARTVVKDITVLVLPTLKITKSGEHDRHPGTLSLSGDTLVAVLRDIAASVAQAGIDRLCLFNGHGGNTALLETVVRFRVENPLRRYRVGFCSLLVSKLDHRRDRRIQSHPKLLQERFQHSVKQPEVAQSEDLCSVQCSFHILIFRFSGGSKTQTQSPSRKMREIVFCSGTRVGRPCCGRTPNPVISTWYVHPSLRASNKYFLSLFSVRSSPEWGNLNAPTLVSTCPQNPRARRGNVSDRNRR
ncbi:MAG: creatininase family protein [Roseobacter sp.]